MPHSAYPAGSDVQAALEAAGLTLTAAQLARLDSLATAAASEFARKVDLVPFLADASPTTRRLDPPVNRAGLLLLDRPALTLTQVAYQPQGDTSTTLVAGTEWNALPAAGGVDGHPYTQIQFTAPFWYGPLGYPYRGAIYVTGRWGAFEDVPDDAWEAIASHAALRLFPSARYATTGGRLSWKEDDVSEDFSVEPGKDVRDGWADAWQSALAVYRNVGL